MSILPLPFSKRLILITSLLAMLVAGLTSPAWLPDSVNAADGIPQVAPTVTPTPDPLEDWDAWLLERERVHKDAMYAEWKAQMGDDAAWMFDAFEQSLSQQLIELKQEVDSLKNTSAASLNAATKLSGYVATPTPVTITEYVEVPVTVTVTEYVEVPVPPTQYEYCSWFEQELTRQMETLSANIATGTFLLIMHESGCNEVLGS